MSTPQNFPLRKNLDTKESSSNTWASWGEDIFRKMVNEKTRFQQQWQLNVAHYLGKQYVEFVGLASSSYYKLTTPPAPKHRVRAVVNILRPIVRTEMARLTSQKPSASVIPATTEEQDIMAAQAGEQAWDSIYRSKKFLALQIQNAFWVSTTGNGFYKVWWDANAIDKTSVDINGENPRGDIRYASISPFNIFIPDPMEQEIEEQPYVIQAYERSLEWVRKFWANGNEVDAPSNSNAVGTSEFMDLSYFGVETPVNGSKPSSVLVKEIYIKPGGHKDFPDGGLITMAGKKVMGVYHELPYSHGQYPFAHSVSIPSGKFWGDSTLVDLIPLQKELNATRSQIIESKRKMSRPQLLVPRGSVDIHKLTNEPGLIIPYTQGMGKPEPLAMTPIPSYVLQEQDRIRNDMEDISGQHQVSRGMAPGGGVQAATAISFLQEKDDSLLATTYLSQEAAIEKVARQTLSLIVDYFTIPRIIKIVGTDSSFDAVELKGSDIRNGTDIRIEAGSSLPTSKQAKQALIMDLMKSGAIAPSDAMELLDFGGFDRMVEGIRRDKKEAQRENLRIKSLDPTQIEMHTFMERQRTLAGTPDTIDPNSGFPLAHPDDPTTFAPMVPVQKWQNHAVHVAVHNDYRKTQEFELLSDNIKLEFEKHVSMHEFMMQQQMMASPTDMAQDQQPQQGMELSPETMGGMVNAQ